MNILHSLQREELTVVEKNLQTVQFPKDACIMEQGSQGDGCYFIEEGSVRVEYDSGETDTDVVLNYLEPGMVMGEFSLIDHQPRSASLYAHTSVTADWLSLEKFDALANEYPHISNQLLTAISQNLIQIVRNTNKQLADFMSEGSSSEQVDGMIADALEAQRSFQNWSEMDVDSLLKDVADAIMNEARILAEETVKESGFGVVGDKVEKIRFASESVYKTLAGKPGSGCLQFDKTSQVEELASPMGVILGIIPLTNPVPTIVFKTLICLKSRNALIMSCHRNALKLGSQAGSIIQRILEKHNAPVHLVQWIQKRSSRKLTNMFMRHKDTSFILATGGPSIVRAAYSSGTPAIGVGAGNAPVYIARDSKVEQAAEMIISSKSFDNGVICGSENNLVVDAAVYDEFTSALKNHGARILDKQEISLLSEKIFDSSNQRLSIFTVGQSARILAEKAGITVNQTIRLLVIPLESDLVTGPFGMEKLAPVLSLFRIHNELEAFDLCKKILSQEGKGHTAIIHTHSKELAERYAAQMPASRILVNMGGSLGCIGSGNGLSPSLTLGCGTLGGTSTTDNVGYKNLLNIKRLAFAL